MWIAYVILLAASAYSLHEYTERMKGKKKKGASAIDLKIVVYVLNVVLCVTRLIWLIDPNPISAPWGFHPWRTTFVGNAMVPLLLYVECRCVSAMPTLFDLLST